MKRRITFALIVLICTIQHGSFAQMTKDSIASTTLIRPSALVAGDSIMIVAPAGILKNREAVIQEAKKFAENWGLKVKIGAHVFTQNNHFAGTDEERAADFQHALDNPNIKAIWSARGGYGSVRILDKIDYTKFKEHPKWIVGYSDITAIHSQVHNFGVESLHAMMATSLEFEEEESKISISTFKKALFGEEIKYEVAGSEYNKIGEANGQLVGGNMTMLLTTLGSKTQLNTDGKILFIEEIGEYKYHIDRMLQAYKRAGYFKNLKGLIVGDMTSIKKNTTVWGTSVEQLILDALSEYDFPIVFGFPAGHEAENRALIMGRTLQLKSTKEKTTVSFE